jgi:energy-coupling factor transporter ATP-binding protein EcfA2
MRLIGIKLGVCDPLVRKALKDDMWYPFGDFKEPSKENGWEWRTEEQKQQEEACRQMYKTVVGNENIKDSLDITVNCIVGKNGSGKSTLLDIYYRIINNFAWKLIDQLWFDNTLDKNPQKGHVLTEAGGFDATLYYETDGIVGSLRYNYGHLEMNYHTQVEDAAINGEPFTKYISKSKMERLTRHFFYTICTNYSIHSLNQRDYTPNKLWVDQNHNINGKWIQGLFHKNDGYVTPIVMVPYRTEDDYIDIDNENDLAKQRLATLAILFGSQGKRFMDSYKPCELAYRFDHNAAERYNKKFNDLFKNRLLLNKNCSVVKREIRRVWNKNLRGHYSEGYGSLRKEVREAVLSYLVYKTLKTCIQYRSYGMLMGIRSFSEEELKRLKPNVYGFYLEYDPNKVVDVVKEILFQDSDIHINLKIHQMLTYVQLGHYKTANLELPEDYHDDPQQLTEYGWNKMPVEMLYDRHKDKESGKRKAFRTFDEVSRLMPPAIFEWDINFIKKDSKENEKETLTQMSSGERQLMHSISYIIYHLKNLQSVTDGDYRIRYHNVCLVFDEAELYYHPEFQRGFISNLVIMLSWCHINPQIIRGINILIATHSPFVLSDVPLANTLYLDEGRVAEKKKETFCGNVHEMLGGNFFLDYSIGEVARKNVEDIIMLYNSRYDKEREQQNREYYLAEKPRLQYVAEHVADEYLSKTCKKMMDELAGMYEEEESLDVKIAKAREELESLLKQKEAEAYDKGEV